MLEVGVLIRNVNQLGDLIVTKLFGSTGRITISIKIITVLKRFYLLPKTKSMASMMFDLPLPLAPTTAEKF